ncbi:MAG: hypothetical protein KDI71_21575, partial [Xanthomonadales bacterium]|nr:hypothetical protein [Xanthomonadales bacterium]
INTLVDDIHGDLNGQGDCTVPQTIAAGASYSCAFSATVNGNAGDTETDTITAAGTDDDSNPISASGSATVTILDVLPAASLVLSASPQMIDEPGGLVQFTVIVDALGSPESLTLTQLTDAELGDLSGRGNCVVPQVIPASGSYQCQFDLTILGLAGDQVTRLVSARVEDDDGNSLSRDASVTIVFGGSDWGDAPDLGYPTSSLDDGARHTIVAGFFLGSSVDAEGDGQSDFDALGDDNDGNDDDDGVIFDSVLIPGATARLSVTASQVGMLDAWVDFDGDGSWDGAGEHVFTSQPLAPGANSLSFIVPGQIASNVVARFRYSSVGGLTANGPADDGEVEDYRLAVESVEIVPVPLGFATWLLMLIGVVGAGALVIRRSMI